MKRTIAMAVSLLLAACGSVEDRDGCRTSADCPAGQYCASTSEGRVCWEDPVPPTVGGVTVTCLGEGPCLRDGTLRVTASAADDREVFDVSVTLDLDGGERSVPMTLAGGVYAADLPLREWPFPHLEHAVSATVAVRDGARGDPVTGSATGPAVTRLRAAIEVDPGAATVPELTSAAVAPDGTILVGANTGKLYVVSPAGTATGVAVSGSRLTAPALAPGAIWIGSADGRLYAVGFDGTPIGTGCNANGALLATPAIEGSYAIAGSQARYVAVAGPGGFCDLTSVADGAVSAAGVIDASDHLTVPAGGVLKSFTVPGTGVLEPRWTAVDPVPAVGDAVSAPPAIDGGGNVWTVALDGSLHRTTSAGQTEELATVGTSASGLVVLAGDAVVVGDQSGKLRRYASSGALDWTTATSVGGVPRTPLVLSGDAELLVGTRSGTVAAVRSDTGELAWSGAVAASPVVLADPTLHTPPGQAGRVLSDAYFPAENGRIYRVIVDGQLDAQAPWPKAHHDVRNTGNAGSALP